LEPGDPRLVSEAAAAGVVAVDRVRPFHGDHTIEFPVGRAPDRAHPAGADLSIQPIATDDHLTGAHPSSPIDSGWLLTVFALPRQGSSTIG
jgi:hypothetical protein